MQVLIKHAANGEVNRGTTEERERESERRQETVLSVKLRNSRNDLKSLSKLWRFYGNYPSW